MANTKVSQLPVYTGDTSGSHLIMNDAANTATYTVSKETLFSGYYADSSSFNSRIIAATNEQDLGQYATTSSLNAASSSFNAYTSSINNFSASVLSYTSSINNRTGSFVTTSSFNSFTSSVSTFSASFDTRINSITSSTVNTGSLLTTASFNSFTSSYKSGSFTGSFSGSFTGNLTGTATNANYSAYTLTQNLNTNGDYTFVFVTTGSNGYLQTYSDATPGILYNPSTNQLKMTGSLFGTASLATSASYAVTASYWSGSILNATSASYALTASYALNATTDTGSLTLTSSFNAFTASAAISSASFDSRINAITSSATINTGSFVTTSSFNSFTSSYTTGSFTGSFTGNLTGTATTASYTVSSSYAANGGVTQLLAGANISLSPSNGLGQVTITSTGGSGTYYNTSTGSYGSFYDTTTQTNPVANVPRSMSFNTTDISNGVLISSSNNPYNTYIKFTNAGTYNLQFSAQISKTNPGGTDSTWIWLRKNGSDVAQTNTEFDLSQNGQGVAAWNWFINAASNDYYQIMWSSNATDIQLTSYASPSYGPAVPSVILTANRVDTFLSNTGSFSGSFVGILTGTATSSSYAETASYALNATLNTGSLTLTSSFYAYTSSLNNFSSSFNLFSASINLQTSSLLSYTSSINAKTGSFATTGSNTFVGNQTITGSLTVTSTTAVVNSLIAANSSSLYLTSGSNLYVQNNGYVEITGSFLQSGSLISYGPNTLVGNTTITGSLTMSGSITLTTGSITMPNRPAFRIIGTGGAIYGQVISGSKLTVDYNQGNYFNTSSGLFTAPIAGLYQVNVVTRTFSNANSTINQLIVYKSGSATGGDVTQIMVEFGTNTSMNHTGGSTISSLQVGDTLRAIIAVGTCSFDQNDNFSVAYIG